MYTEPQQTLTPDYMDYLYEMAKDRMDIKINEYERRLNESKTTDCR
jgi:hypothetical protein